MIMGVIFGTFALFLILNVPIGIAIGLSVLAYILIIGDTQLTFLAANMFSSCDSFPLMAIPFFILAGGLMESGGLSKRLVDFANACVGHLKGGLAMVTVMTCLFFGAISGSGPATVAAIGAIMVPFMVESGYSKRFSVALVAASGCLGVIIPPSIPMVMYGVATGASIGTMFMGGFIPGILCAVALMIVAKRIVAKEGFGGNEQAFSWMRVWKEFKNAIWALMVPVIILGGIYGGIFTPTEAAVVSVFYGLIAGLFIYKELNFRKIFLKLADSAMTTAAILIIVGTGTTLGRILAMAGVPGMVTDLMLGLTDNVYVLLLMLNVFLLIVGCVMDTTAAILILSPILYPIVEIFGVNIIHFGVMMIINLAIGFITPPVGINLFTAVRISDVGFSEVVKRIIPLLLALICALLVITYIPMTVTLLPKIFGKIPW
ncbi:MAG: TRAP transporter large permease [Clostridiales Family XIII bacterium]|jgi:C4-dicarboxylate transporter DctM subunit|nr:TRAP transporter large permease [Clostridiales Family XIII bacterium]